MLNGKQYKVGDLVWIPANTPLMYFLPENGPFPCKEKGTEEPSYGLILSQKDSHLRVLVGKEEFYVLKKQVYGVENDYKS